MHQSSSKKTSKYEKEENVTNVKNKQSLHCKRGMGSHCKSSCRGSIGRSKGIKQARGTRPDEDLTAQRNISKKREAHADPQNDRRRKRKKKTINAAINRGAATVKIEAETKSPDDLKLSLRAKRRKRKEHIAPQGPGGNWGIRRGHKDAQKDLTRGRSNGKEGPGKKKTPRK